MRRERSAEVAARRRGPRPDPGIPLQMRDLYRHEFPPASSRQIVIVGHGRSPEGKAWARRIDAANIVIRMWDCAWQPLSDYGIRYDIGFFEIGGGLVGKFRRNQRGRDPSLGWVASWLYGLERQLPQRTEVIDQTPWNRVGKGLGGIGQTGRLQFTRGTIAACWAIERASPGDEIILVGFDNIRAGATLPLDQAFCRDYQRNPGSYSFNGYRGGLRKCGNHDFLIERPVMEHLAEKASVRLSFADVVWT